MMYVLNTYFMNQYVLNGVYFDHIYYDTYIMKAYIMIRLPYNDMSLFLKNKLKYGGQKKSNFWNNYLLF